MTPTTTTQASHLELLSAELQMLRVKWGLWKGFFSSDEAVKALNRASHLAAACIQDSLLRDVALGLARVLDPAQQGPNENVSIKHFIDGELPSDLRSFQEKVCHVRNKRLGHNDLNEMQDMKRIAYGFTDVEVDQAFTRIMEIIQTAEDQTSDGNESDPWIHEGQQAADSFLQKLQ